MSQLVSCIWDTEGKYLKYNAMCVFRKHMYRLATRTFMFFSILGYLIQSFSSEQFTGRSI